MKKKMAVLMYSKVVNNVIPKELLAFDSFFINICFHFAPAKYICIKNYDIFLDIENCSQFFISYNKLKKKVILGSQKMKCLTI